ncbi:MAG: hypothetical protein WCQ96_02995 [Patescibacteria group bacterium]
MTYQEKRLKEFREKFGIAHEKQEIPKTFETYGELEAFLSQTIEELWNQGKADMIVDLYQIKASLNRPLSCGEMEKPQDVYRYHFLMTIIAKLCDINDIRGEDIEEAIERRAEAERMRDNNLKIKE